ncbi:MAG TPA: nitroreductase family protein [Candidatus Binatia bacterium]|nr:nitroreductase family protein [Candidatus Binatia bacterium]
MDLLPEIAKRKSPRAFQTRPVEEEKIQLLLQAFRWAPSSYNKQPWRIVLVTDPAVREQMHEGLMTGNRRWAVKAPILAVIVSRVEADDVRHDNAIPYYLYDCGQAAMSLVLQAEHMGLRCHQMAGWEQGPVRAALAIPDEEQPIVVMAIGYEGDIADLDERSREKEMVPRTRKELREFAFRDRWGKPAQ